MPKCRMAALASVPIVGQVLQSRSKKYVIQEFVGEGSYGKVAKCLDLSSNKTVAVKITTHRDAENELYMLHIINQLNVDQTNIVKFYERFHLFDLTCLVFEMLDMDFFDLIITQKFGPVCVDHIRPVAKQLLVALEALHSIDIMHADIKPDNIMMISIEDNLHRVKLIDFGMALHSFMADPGDQRQAIGYRAPEIYLGLPYSDAIDIWALGCTLAFLYLGYTLFFGRCQYLVMNLMVDLLGIPPDHMLQNGLLTRKFFCEEEDQLFSRWRLLTPVEYMNVNNVQAQTWPKTLPRITSLDQLVYLNGEGEAAEMEDRKAFVDLLKRMLHMDEEKRITPTEALQHPFITMTHLNKDIFNGNYVTRAQNIMSISSLECLPD